MSRGGGGIRGKTPQLMTWWTSAEASIWEVVYPWSSAIDSNSMTRWNIRSNACTCALVGIYEGAQCERENQIRRRRFIMAGTSCET